MKRDRMCRRWFAGLLLTFFCTFVVTSAHTASGPAKGTLILTGGDQETETVSFRQDLQYFNRIHMIILKNLVNPVQS
jgi:hypothetical protein